jgi:hypothetical protein
MAGQADDTPFDSLSEFQLECKIVLDRDGQLFSTQVNG